MSIIYIEIEVCVCVCVMYVMPAASLSLYAAI